MILSISKAFTLLAKAVAMKSPETDFPYDNACLQATMHHILESNVRSNNRLKVHSHPLWRLVVLLVLSASHHLTGVSVAQETGETHGKKASQFVRLLKEGEEPVALQTSITTFQATKDEKLTVDLIGAIHVGEASYYRQLNELFRKYDAVLYELVAPKGTRVPKGGTAPSSPVSYMQNGMTEALGLEFQLNSIDYTVANFVHADMTPEEFAQSMKKREESLGKMFFRAIGQSLVKSTSGDSSADLKMIQALLAKETDDRQFKLKRAFAEQFADLDGAMLVFEGPDGSTLVTERNKKALDVLSKELDKGSLSIGIFYGAGHMKDMAKRLKKDFKMTLKDTQWLTAWDLADAPPDSE